MSRREFPRKVKAAAIARANGHCERCKAALKKGEAEVDHILEDALGGEPVLANAQVLCRVCHTAKTAERVRMIRKADRQRDKDTGAIRPKQAIKSRGFDTSQHKAKRVAKTINQLPRKRLYAGKEEQ